MEKKERITNAEFAKENMKFQEACMKANIQPGARQASKYRRNKGAAFKGQIAHS